MTILRLIAVTLAVTVMAVGWFKGERRIRKFGLREAAVDLFVALWRLLMLTVTVVGIISIVGLWQAQDAGEGAKAAGAQTRKITNDLCQHTLAWQRSALVGLRADVRIAAAELLVAEAELRDAETVLEEAQVLVGDDEPPSPAEEFFLGAFRRDVARFKNEVSVLEAEGTRREATLAELESTALSECPPLD